MSMYEIQGGRPLGGRLRVQGAKNSVLPLLAAALLAPGQSVIHNCPDLSDVSATLDILALLGCRVAREGETVTGGRRRPERQRHSRAADAGDALLGDFSGGAAGPYRERPAVLSRRL